MDIKPRPKYLTELAQEAFALEQILLENGGEIDEKIEAWLATLSSELAHKVDSYDYTMKRLASSSDMLKQRADAIRKVALAMDNTIARMKQTVAAAMQAMNVTTLTGNEIVLKYRRASNPSLILENEEIVPNEYKIVHVKIDNEGIKNALKEGESIPGARLEYSFFVTSKLNKELLK